MSKITNIRLPSTGFTAEVDPIAFNQSLEALQQIVRQLNTTYTPQTTENTRGIEDWMTGTVGPISRSTLEDSSTFAYGAFVDYTDQTHTATETAKAVTWNTTVYAKHVSIGSPTSRIVFSKPGRYRIEFTAQLNSESSNAKTFWFWPRINGTDVPGATMRITVHDNGEAKTIARTGMFQMNAGDYLEAMWAVDSLNTSLQAYAAETFCPAAPSVTLTLTSVTHEQ
jgi:hypothetical protein